MAQRDKEDMELHVSEKISLCINNCGFPGNPATKNMCQSCFKSVSAHPQSCSPRSVLIRSADSATEAIKEAEEKSEVKVEVVSNVQVKQVNRCFSCRKRVGLTGFRCRCGQLFCGEHRYSDRHECGFDYKAAGRDAIALQNPAVRAAKMVKI